MNNSTTSSTTVLILAAGEARRFQGVCKQLLRVKDERIIERIVRQVCHRGHLPFIVTNNEEIIHAVKLFAKHEVVHRPESYKVTCDTLLNTQELWGERTIVLLGDTIYSKKLMDSIFAYDGEIRVFGNTHEVFAMSFTTEVHEKVLETLNEAIKTYPSKLRTFYKLYCGYDSDELETRGVPLESTVFDYRDDWSRDIDSLEEYHNMVLELVNSNTLDDLPTTR